MDRAIMSAVAGREVSMRAFLPLMLARRIVSSYDHKPRTRTIYNSMAGRFEQMPIGEIEELVEQGKMIASVWDHWGREHFTYRLTDAPEESWPRRP
jgi:hypothetical protein